MRLWLSPCTCGRTVAVRKLWPLTMQRGRSGVWTPPTAPGTPSPPLPHAPPGEVSPPPRRRRSCTATSQRKREVPRPRRRGRHTRVALLLLQTPYCPVPAAWCHWSHSAKGRPWAGRSETASRCSARQTIANSRVAYFRNVPRDVFGPRLTTGKRPWVSRGRPRLPLEDPPGIEGGGDRDTGEGAHAARDSAAEQVADESA